MNKSLLHPIRDRAVKTGMTITRALLCAALIAFAFALTAPPVQAQQYGDASTTWTLLSAGKVTSPFDDVAPYQSNYTAVGVAKYEEVYLQLTASPSNTSSGQFKVVWSLSGDGTTYANLGVHATNYLTLAMPAAGALGNFGTNIYVGSAGYLKLGLIGATNSVLTNVTFKVYAKPRRNG